MSVKKAVKKVVDTVKKAVAPKVVKTETVKTVTCSNCTGKGEQCSVCTPIFVDTFK